MEKAVMASREIMNLGHGLSFVKLQTDATDDADELMQNMQLQVFILFPRLNVAVITDPLSSSEALTRRCSVNI